MVKITKVTQSAEVAKPAGAHAAPDEPAGAHAAPAVEKPKRKPRAVKPATEPAGAHAAPDEPAKAYATQAVEKPTGEPVNPAGSQGAPAVEKPKRKPRAVKPATEPAGVHATQAAQAQPAEAAPATQLAGSQGVPAVEKPKRKPRAAKPATEEKPAGEPATQAAQLVEGATQGVTASQLAGSQGVPAAEPKKRQPSDKKSKFELQGVGIAPSRVKSVLAHVALNPREARAREALRAAENRPVLPKQVKDGPAPVLPPQGPQKHIAELDAETVACVADAVAAHSAILREEYERETVAKLPDTERERYRAARAAAKKLDGFSSQAFHVEFSAKFYEKFEAFQAGDSYSLGPDSRYNEWTRAIALINKLCVRLSHGTRDILAAYLDNVVLQLAENAVQNCVAAGKTIVKLEHAVLELDNFSQRVPLAPWLRTLPSFDHAKQYVAHRANQKAAAVSEVEPAKPDVRYSSVYEENAMFKTYVEDLCLFVQQTHKTALNLSTDFKQFCADMVYGAILRVAEVLKQNVEYSEVKTISDGLMKHTIRCINLAAGIDNQVIMADLNARLAKFEAFREPEDDEIIGV